MDLKRAECHGSRATGISCHAIAPFPMSAGPARGDGHMG
jgi:hypothetical protein